MKVLASPSTLLGVELSSVSIASMDDEQVCLVRNLVYEHHLVVFRNQDVSILEYVDFARKVGRPQVYFQKNYHHPEHPEIFVSSNVPENGKKIGVSGTGRYWHTDCAFEPDPLSLTLLCPRILPKSIRETYYINMNQVYQELPPDLKAQVDGKYAVHEGKWRYKVQACDIDHALIDILNDVEKMAPATTHPAVITHPVSHLPALYVSEGFTTGIVGLGHEENKQVLANLFSFIQQEKHIHTHVWQEGDILLWDNRMLIHKASSVPKGESSMSYRIGIYDSLPFYLTTNNHCN
jgi:taurine dioxygenase